MADTSYLSLEKLRTNTLGSKFNDYSRSYLFLVEITEIPSALGTADRGIITWFVSKTETPHQSNGVVKVPWMNSEIKIPGKTTFDDWSVTVRDSKGIYEFFQNWLNLTFDKEASFGISNYPNEVTGKINVKQIDEKGMGIRSFTLYHAWVADVEKISLGMSEEGIVEFGVKIVYDYYKLDKSIAK